MYELVKAAIHDYRKEGKELMVKLGNKYGLDITIEEEYQQLISRGNKEIPRKGTLSKRWNYSFHGSECVFYNTKHQKPVEVVLSNPPEFGHIDSWFLLRYMQAIEKYKYAIEDMNHSRLKIIIEKLYKSDEIQKIER